MTSLFKFVVIDNTGKAKEAVDKLSEAIKRETGKPDTDKKLLSNIYCNQIEKTCN